MNLSQFVKNNKILMLLHRLIDEIIDVRQFITSFHHYVIYFTSLARYSKSSKERVINFDIFPRIHDATRTTKTDPHYFYQGCWAFRKIVQSRVKEHVDVGSQLDFVKYLSRLIKVTFIDIRPLELPLENLECRTGSILALPYMDNSVRSLSTLHVIEHIGLGRYGDPLDHQGSIKAARELSRVLAPGGSLYLSTLVGRPRTCFNAHRIWTPSEVVGFFPDLVLHEFSAVDDDGKWVPRAVLDDFKKCDYALGLFHFTKISQ